MCGQLPQSSHICYLADASASFACPGAVRDKDLVAPDPTVSLPSSVRSSEGTAEAQLNNGKRGGGGGGGGNDTRPRYSCYIWFVGQAAEQESAIYLWDVLRITTRSLMV